MSDLSKLTPNTETVAALKEAMAAKEAIDIGMEIAERHEVVVREMAIHFFADVDLADLHKLLHGNKVWLASQIMKALQQAEAKAISP